MISAAKSPSAFEPAATACILADTCERFVPCHHAQRIIAECYLRIKWSTYYSVLQVIDASKRVNQLSKTVSVKAYGHGVNGKVTAVLVILKCAVLNNRIA